MNFETIKELIAQGMPLTTRDEINNTMLHNLITEYNVTEPIQKILLFVQC